MVFEFQRVVGLQCISCNVLEGQEIHKKTKIVSIETTIVFFGSEHSTLSEVSFHQENENCSQIEVAASNYFSSKAMNNLGD